jgi:hypothetical protein
MLSTTLCFALKKALICFSGKYATLPILNKMERFFPRGIALGAVLAKGYC